MKDFQVLQDAIGSWSEENWGKDRGPNGTLAHLTEEVEHLQANPYNPMAYADAFILLINSAREAGYTMEDIYRAIEAKHKINVSRIWEEPDEDGVTRHIRETKL